MDDSTASGHQRTVSVEPPVHVETFATHWTATWKANPLSAFTEAAKAVKPISPSTPVVTDSTETAGRERQPLAAVSADAQTTYVRVEPSTPWTLSWERRTWPVVSISGTPSPARCRAAHQATTDCPTWPDDALATLERVLASVR